MAASPINYPLINGVRHSFPSIELKLNGLIFVGFKSINYSRKRSRSMIYGNNADPIGKTRGKNEYSCDAEFYLAEFNQFLASLGPGYGDLAFTINVTYTENSLDTIQDVILGCTLDSSEVSQSEGTDALVRKFEMNPLKILFNGVDDSAIPLVGVQTLGLTHDHPREACRDPVRQRRQGAVPHQGQDAPGERRAALGGRRPQADAPRVEAHPGDDARSRAEVRGERAPLSRVLRVPVARRGRRAAR
jgi:hypothetical protein